MKKNLKYLFILSCLSSCTIEKTEKVILLPPNYSGKVVVIFNQKNGAKEQYKNNKRLYVIPEDGVLLTQFKEIEGIYVTQYYMGTDQQEIDISTCENSFSKSQFIICNEEFGVMGNSDDKNSLRYFGFYITKPNDAGAFFSAEYEKKFNDIIIKKTGYHF